MKTPKSYSLEQRKIANDFSESIERITTQLHENQMSIQELIQHRTSKLSQNSEQANSLAMSHTIKSNSKRKQQQSENQGNHGGINFPKLPVLASRTTKGEQAVARIAPDGQRRLESPNLNQYETLARRIGLSQCLPSADRDHGRLNGHVGHGTVLTGETVLHLPKDMVVRVPNTRSKELGDRSKQSTPIMVKQN